MKIQLGIILAVACLAVAGCGGNEEAALNPSHADADGSVSPSNDGTEAAPSPAAGEDETDVVVPPVVTPPDGLPDAEAYRPDDSLSFGRFMGPFPLVPGGGETIAPGGTIAMPAPTRVFRLTDLRWIYLGDGQDPGGKSQVLSCYDKSTRPTGILPGYLEQRAEGRLVGFKEICATLSATGSGSLEDAFDFVPTHGPACPEGEVRFGVVIRYDGDGIRSIESIGCAKPSWVPVNE